MLRGRAEREAAELRGAAERERLVRERAEALALCDARAEAAAAVDAALGALARALDAWRGTVPGLQRLRDAGQAWLGPDLGSERALGPAAIKAGGYPFGRFMRVRDEPPPDRLRSLAEGDPVLLLARRERGEEVDGTLPEFLGPRPAVGGPPAPGAAPPAAPPEDEPPPAAAAAAPVGLDPDNDAYARPWGGLGEAA